MLAAHSTTVSPVAASTSFNPESAAERPRARAPASVARAAIDRSDSFTRSPEPNVLQRSTCRTSSSTCSSSAAARSSEMRSPVRIQWRNRDSAIANGVRTLAATVAASGARTNRTVTSGASCTAARTQPRTPVSTARSIDLTAAITRTTSAVPPRSVPASRSPAATSARASAPTSPDRRASPRATRVVPTTLTSAAKAPPAASSTADGPVPAASRRASRPAHTAIAPCPVARSRAPAPYERAIVR